MPRTVPVPVPPDLWRRLAALDRRCDIKMERFPTSRFAEGGRHTSGFNFPRMWEVRIWPTDAGLSQAVACQGADLAGVLAGAVRMAEEKGWGSGGYDRG